MLRLVDQRDQRKEKEFCQEVLFNAKPYRPLSLMTVDEAYEEAITMPKQGTPWPWPTLTKLTYGMQRGRVYGIGGGYGIGKTSAWHCICHQAIQEGYKPGLLMLEETPGNTLKNLATFTVGKRLNRPDGSFTPDELRGAIDTLKGKLILCNHLMYYLVRGVHSPCFGEHPPPHLFP